MGFLHGLHARWAGVAGPLFDLIDGDRDVGSERLPLEPQLRQAHDALLDQPWVEPDVGLLLAEELGLLLEELGSFLEDEQFAPVQEAAVSGQLVEFLILYVFYGHDHRGHGAAMELLLSPLS